METINQIFGFIGKLFEWWFTVMPWEQAVFVRGGNKTKVLKGGIYFKIPFYDRVYVQPIRLRMIDLSVQTVSTKDGKTITIKSVVGYSIKDISKMYNSLSHPDMTLSGLVMGGIAEHIKNTDSKDVSPLSVETYILEKLSQMDYGLGDLSVKITSWADVKTFRLIQDSSWINEGTNMKYVGEK